MKLKLLGLGCLLIIVGMFGLSPCQAVLVWSDDFNDGDYLGWTLLQGSFSAANLRLECGSAVWNFIYHSSTVDEGEWQFDIALATGGARVAFMALDVDGVGFSIPNDGYFLEFDPQDGYIRLSRNVGGSESAMGAYATTVAQASFQVWVARNSTGYFQVWIDGVYQFQAYSTHHVTSLYFIVLLMEDGAIDNIFAYNHIIHWWIDSPTTPSTTPPPPPPPLVLIAGALVVVVIVVVVVVVLYRRRT